MARAMVDMEQGIYIWPDGRKPVKKDGSPVISKVELVRVGGYSSVRTGHQYRWFEDPYFKRQVALEKARRETNLPDIIEQHPTALLQLGREMIDEARRRLKATPEDFTIAQLITFGPQVVKQGLELEAAGEPSSKKSGSNRIGEFNAFLGDTFVQMNGNERDKFAATAENAIDSRKEKLNKMLDALQAEEEDDADVIDAEISPEPT